jgi:ethanolamine utilization protein EutP
MKRLILIGRSESGKSTLIAAMRDGDLSYHKTQYVLFSDNIIDTPGEYAETKNLGGALAVYSYESDLVGLVASSTEHYTLFPPNIVGMSNRPVIGVVTKIDHPDSRPDMAKMWLEECGCEKIFFTSSYTGEGVDELLDFLRS